MHRIEIEQIGNYDLRTHVAQRLRAFVFISHHRTHGSALLQEQFDDRAPYPADAARRPSDQTGICHVAPIKLPKLIVRPFEREPRCHCAAVSSSRSIFASSSPATASAA
jgi:hypothetical protein